MTGDDMNTEALLQVEAMPNLTWGDPNAFHIEYSLPPPLNQDTSSILTAETPLFLNFSNQVKTNLRRLEGSLQDDPMPSLASAPNRNLTAAGVPEITMPAVLVPQETKRLSFFFACIYLEGPDDFSDLCREITLQVKMANSSVVTVGSDIRKSVSQNPCLLTKVRLCVDR
jgi:hypothetical protein